MTVFTPYKVLEVIRTLIVKLKYLNKFKTGLIMPRNSNSQPTTQMNLEPIVSQVVNDLTSCNLPFSPYDVVSLVQSKTNSTHPVDTTTVRNLVYGMMDTLLNRNYVVQTVTGPTSSFALFTPSQSSTTPSTQSQVNSTPPTPTTPPAPTPTTPPPPTTPTTCGSRSTRTSATLQSTGSCGSCGSSGTRESSQTSQTSQPSRTTSKTENNTSPNVKSPKNTSCVGSTNSNFTFEQLIGLMKALGNRRCTAQSIYAGLCHPSCTPTCTVCSETAYGAAPQYDMRRVDVYKTKEGRLIIPKMLTTQLRLRGSVYGSFNNGTLTICRYTDQETPESTTFLATVRKDGRVTVPNRFVAKLTGSSRYEAQIEGETILVLAK